MNDCSKLIGRSKQCRDIYFLVINLSSLPTQLVRGAPLNPQAKERSPFSSYLLGGKNSTREEIILISDGRGDVSMSSTKLLPNFH